MISQPETPSRGWSRRSFLATSALATAGTALTACSGSDGSSGTAAKPVSSASMAAALKKPTEITFWTWIDLKKQVAMFEAKYPNIKVKVVNAGQSADEYKKLRTVLKAGTGAPDVVQIGLDTLSAFVITKDLLDLAPYGAGGLKDDFVDWTWKQVSVGDKVYAIPQDTGPMGMLYRKDVFDHYGLSVPKTWEEFAAQGRKLHSATSGIAMTNLPDNDAPNWLGLAWQAGARPFKVNGSNVTIGVNSSKMKQLADFWTPLVQQGIVSADPDFNNDWYAGLTKGTYATWVTAGWAPLFLQGAAAKSSGKWRVAPIPQWSDGAAVSGNWGGSTNAVTAQTKHPEAAAAFAMFINHDKKSSLSMATDLSLFPPLRSTLSDPAYVGHESTFFGGQKVNQLFSQYSETVSADFQWSPFNDYVTNSYNPTVGTALTRKKSLSDALDGWQESLTSYARKQGFKVTG
ncbi:ABC transporter substrate-binding protein [Streptomyces sp. NPDC090499]|uniref:ABC transporter substrate-binding protein n=1 Tax=Streptomyces sp. NPDC090499 TaxID=3365965 RepID=UPI003820CB91